MSSHLRLGLPKGLFPVGLPVNILKYLAIQIPRDCALVDNLCHTENRTSGELYCIDPKDRILNSVATVNLQKNYFPKSNLPDTERANSHHKYIDHFQTFIRGLRKLPEIKTKY